MRKINNNLTQENKGYLRKIANYTKGIIFIILLIPLCSAGLLDPFKTKAPTETTTQMRPNAECKALYPNSSCMDIRVLDKQGNIISQTDSLKEAQKQEVKSKNVTILNQTQADKNNFDSSDGLYILAIVTAFVLGMALVTYPWWNGIWENNRL